MLSALEEHADYLMCTACGMQYNIKDRSRLTNCRICDDPRQFVPPTGQTFTTLRDLWQGEFANEWKEDEEVPGVTSIRTQPQFAIGQRAFLLQTEHGNVLWDLIAYLDEETVDKIQSMGGLKAIVISHPHYYTTNQVWAKVFNCPIISAVEDLSWYCRRLPEDPMLELMNESEDTRDIVPGMTAIKVKGHFPGSLVLLWKKVLFIADSLVIVPSGLYHQNRQPGTMSFGFYYSIPNMLQDLDFVTALGAFSGLVVRDRDMDEQAKKDGKTTKWKVRESMRIQISHMGYDADKHLPPQ